MNRLPLCGAALLALLLPTAQAQTAPKFNQWYLQLCSVGGNAGLNYVVAGYQNYCALTIKVTPNGAVPVKAVFSYELEWTEGGRPRKVALPGKDIWTPHGGGDVVMEVDTYQYDVFLPLNVRNRPDRQYTAINVIGNFTFSNGSTKKIFEKINVVR
ncbi:hypothetical protein Deipr_1637 [Deinococcus proteolyticus MRP]|uniref:Uncharacterized protein n=1 Tax=Deinococcus proteolyticus (strain ATCC 35074 / DSM 20540 / JCM 6276 / NBRC 101906 / NCIMB 13154 / VKM Ac-1939 / CCM 2703 / MRP) TaxID=693977 RepID=F0RKR3_DEIPM|nr:MULTISPECIES: hypothetical protein [Deinococcus]ADY26775.1 hypothetical protein Deipr_1637 [Deinococcus proteolyticus MRP]MCY1702905.1 hypothetical protein [Deinococcus sp. SL84]